MRTFVVSGPVDSAPRATMPRPPASKVLRVIMAMLALGAVAGVLTASAVSGAFKAIQYSPAITGESLVNPYIGYAPDARGSGYDLPFSLVHMGVSWRELEPEDGVYDFDGVEQAGQFDKWAAEGKKIILRVVLDYPGSTAHSDLPVWLYAAIRGAGTAYNGSLGMGFSPDYAEPALIEAHGRLMAALGERYNGDARIAFIELGSLGHGGEWHGLVQRYAWGRSGHGGSISLVDCRRLHL